LLQTQERLGELLRHEHASLAEVQRLSPLPAGTPLFSAIFNYRYDPHQMSLALAEDVELLPGARLLRAQERTPYPLGASVDDFSTGFSITAQADRRIGAQRICDYLLRAVTVLTEALEQQPHRLAGRLDILPAMERHKLLRRWSGTAAAVGGATALDRYASQVRADPQATAVVAGEHRISYAQLDLRVNRLARQLMRHGVGAERVVGIWADRSLEMVIGVLGILKAGGCYLPLDPAYPQRRLQRMLAEARPLLIVGADMAAAEALAPDIARLRLAGWEEAVTAAEELAVTVLPQPQPGHPAYVIYTSGSSGDAKGVIVTHAGLAALASELAARMGITSRSRVLQLASLNFDVSVSEILMALSHGATLVVAPAAALSGEGLRELLVKQRITHLSLTPSVLATVPKTDDLALQCVVVGGETCAPELIAKWSADLRLINAYGPTESSVCTTMSAPLHGGQPAQIGTPLEGTRVYVLDAALEPAPIGVDGELYIAGCGLARGYLQRPALTAERFVPDPHGAAGSRMYRTGDVVRWTEDGVLEYLGRADAQVKVRGHRIELGEIEAALNAQAPVERAAVAVREYRSTGKYLAAYVVLRAGQSLDVEGLRAGLAEQLPGHMIPAVFMALPALPLGATGKLDRHALPELSATASTGSDEPPQTPTEVRLAAIWCQVLQCEQVGRAENFFHSGGHSLLALQVVARVRDSFGLELPLKTVFDAPQLRLLAAAIDDLLAGHALPAIAPIQAAEESGPAPLSHSQERMWLIQSLNPQTIAYNMAGGLWINGPVDADALSRSFDELVLRHEILRTRIAIVDEQPRQVVESAVPGVLQVFDMRNHAQPDAESARQVTDLARTVFDLNRDPVIRARLYRTAQNRYLLSIVIHHVASDQWSMGLFGRELAMLYNGRITGTPALLPPLALSYRDFARWQRSAAFTAQFDQQLRFWTQRLADLPPVDLPIDYARPKVWTMNGAIHQVQIPGSLFRGIDAYSRTVGATLFMTLFAGFSALLYRLSGQTDLPIGVPVANRTHSAMESLVGTFVNTLVMRTDLAGDPQFAQLVEQVRANALAAFQNQDVSFDRLVQEIGQRGDRSRAPLVQVMFNVTNAPMQGIDFDKVRWEPLVTERGGAQFELTFSVDPEATRMLTVEYNTDLFAPASIERLVGQYFTLLEAAIATPTLRVSRLPLLPQEQVRQLQAWNDTPMPAPAHASFPQLFETQVARSPEAIAVAFEGEVISYRELNALSNRFARHLLASGVKPGAKVGICMSRSIALIVALLAVQKSGATYVPLDPDFPAERLNYMLNDSGAALLITSGTLPPGLELPAALGTVALADLPEDHATAAVENLGWAPAPFDLAYLLYTSGSTGRPKGVGVPHGALANFLISMRQCPGLAAADALAAVTTISFDIAGLELYLPLIVGARVELVSRRVATDGELLAQHLDLQGVTVLQATPATWRMLLEVGWRPGRQFRAFCGGEALSRQLADEILGSVGELWNLYGPTETTIWSTLERIERDGAPISIGRPIDNTQVHILDAGGELAPIGVVGEICIGGAGVADGYHGRPAQTAEKFLPDPFTATAGARLYRTGDLGRWGEDGKLYHLGRSDNQIKVRGYRIELGEIENALGSHPAIQQAIAAVREARPEDPRLVAFVRYRDGQEATANDLKRDLRAKLPDYMVPGIIVAVDAMPLTPNGKVDRAALPNPFVAAPADAVLHEPPATRMERVLAEIWQTVLNVEKVGAADNFFELGGYSLLSLRVAKMVEKRTGRELDPRSLFFQTLREIAGSLESRASKARARAR
ncbi:MAG TPA: amino acid adenylation domain-containing protein, partial [Steroidobacteraceae bacterium]|nr:amino acid adenylation domain-containing protein [Steroidobacteraceae bacterium]